MPAICRDLRRSFRVIAAISALVVSLLSGIACPSPAQAVERNFSPAVTPLVRVDWQGPWSLPPRFRNHCSFDTRYNRYFCSNHCGLDYQFYFCSRASFGCCHIGYGYCDWNGHLRCAP